MKILLLGANGQVGFELQRSLSPLGEVSATTRSGKLPGNVDGLRADLADAGSLAQALQSERWDIVVNAAAYTAVDRAEDEPALAQRINGEALAQIGQWAARNAALVVHYSTDYVFDGQGARPYREDDATTPLGVYGRSKLAGEEALRESGCAHLILRTAWVYGARGGNFAKTMLRLAREREELKVVADQVGAPTGADLLADVTAHAVRSLLAGRGAPGIYHVAASGATSWHEYARFVVTHAQQAGHQLKAGPERVLPIPSSAFTTPARRPHNSRLATTRFQTTFGLALPPWEQGVARMLQEIL